MSDIIVINAKGKEVSLEAWQAEYGLKPGSDQVGKYFSLGDHKLAENLREFGRLVVNELLIRFLDAFREEVGEAVNINSFNRSHAKQLELTSKGFRTAKFSPHEVYMAADVDTVSDEQTLDWVKKAQRVAKRLSIKIRIGYREYMEVKQTFIHFDVCPEFYGKGKPFNQNFHPVPWETAITW